jgi:hypothetical protein
MTKSVRLLIGGFVIVAAVAVLAWNVWPDIGTEDTYIIAESAFKDYAKHRGWREKDFSPPEKGPLKGTLVRLEWKSIAKGGCTIEVDVDRKTANARPSSTC